MNLDEMKEWLRGGYKTPPVPPPLRDGMTEVELTCHMLRYPTFIDADDCAARKNEYDEFMVVWNNRPFVTVRGEISRITNLPPEKWGDLNKVVITAGIGSGQVIAETVALKLEAGHTYQAALDTTYAVCLTNKVANQARERLLCRKIIPFENLDMLEKIVNRNIVWHDPTTYDMSFNGTNFTNDELEKNKLLTVDEIEMKEKYHFSWM